MLRGNKGEWSEVYVLLKLLAEGRVYAADQNLKAIEDICYPILKIIREEVKGQLKKYITGDNIKIYINNKKYIEISKKRFLNESAILLCELRDTKHKGAFQIPKTEKFMKEISCMKLSAPASDKTDIVMKIIDVNTGYKPTVGFSIKSELGALPTLLNAGKTTNFIYKINNVDMCVIKTVNKICRVSAGKNHTDVRGRISKLVHAKAKITYYMMENNIFKDNLILIDSSMDEIIAETLLYFYRDGIINCEEMIEKLEESNPLKYGNVKAYSYKFKKFLTAVALGMKPATAWDGVDEVSGGYIVVTREGDVLAYHIYNRNYFEDYLLRHTKYETASTSRHGFGELYFNDNDLFFKLNLQIRFR